MIIKVQQISRIALRWIGLRQKFGMLKDKREREDEFSALRIKILLWHGREPLDFDVLESFGDADFAHDISGIINDDFLMSARSAAIYHKPKELA